ncbi:MAG: DNA helicase RecQ [Eubacteriales bacterium]|nr:DNA helicase RecQ [Eubacteriales bacterium]
MAAKKMDNYEILRRFFGHSAFREGQEQIIDALVSGRDVCGVMPTGAGKSICYQVPALRLPGVTVVVSPLISLMKDQVEALTQCGIPAAFLNSSMSASEFSETLADARYGAYKLLYVAPERLLTDGFLAFSASMPISMVAVDEAHCVSQWGQDFRPSYLKIVDYIDRLPRRPVVAAFTATATRAVRDDVVRLLRLRDPFVLVTGFDRGNLRFETQAPRDKYAACVRLLRAHPEQSGIVYCATRKTTDELASRLMDDGFSVTRYHAGLSDAERRRNQEDFINDRRLIVVATNAFGMGIDKSNVRFVIHYNMPKNLESYYQEAGRAGRDGEPSVCTLLYGAQDVATCQWLIEHSSDNAELDDRTRAVIRQRDLVRLRQMKEYATTTDCLRGCILRYFGDDAPESCGNCSNCLSEFTVADITVDAQKILSCVYRLRERGQSAGAELTAQILHGSQAKRIAENHYDTLSTYGIMRDVPVATIRAIIDELLRRHCLETSQDEKPVLLLNAASKDVLFGRKKLSRRVSVPPKAEKTKPVTTVLTGKPAGDGEDALFRQLRLLRAVIAKREEVPPYIVFSDATLRAMAAARPTTPEAFQELPGVGQKKLERYGERFMLLIRMNGEGRV